MVKHVSLPPLKVVRSAGRRLGVGRRYARLGLNLLGGGVFIEACHRFPGLSGIQHKHLNDYPPFNFWVKDLVHSMNTDLRIEGEEILGHGMLVSNHISWLDTIILNHAKTLSFIARHDLVDWPFIGTFTDRMHSVFIDRTNKFQAYRSIPAIEARLAEGRSVHVFPESTTSGGRHVLPFYPMFLEAAVRQGVKVQPVAIAYFDDQGNRTQDPAFIGEDSFVDTLNRMFNLPRIHARLIFLEPLDAGKLGRKEMAKQARRSIMGALAGLRV